MCQPSQKAHLYTEKWTPCFSLIFCAALVADACEPYAIFSLPVLCEMCELILNSPHAFPVIKKLRNARFKGNWLFNAVSKFFNLIRISIKLLNYFLYYIIKQKDNQDVNEEANISDSMNPEASGAGPDDCFPASGILKIFFTLCILNQTLD